MAMATPMPATPGAKPAATPSDFDALLTVQEHLEQVRSHQEIERSVSGCLNNRFAVARGQSYALLPGCLHFSLMTRRPLLFFRSSRATALFARPCTHSAQR